MSWRLLGTLVALLFGLALLGSVSGPNWAPEPLSDPIIPQTPDTTIGGLAAGLRTGRVHNPGTFEVAETEVVVQLDGYVVNGLLRLPIGAPEPMPGMVFVHGAGTGKAYEAFVEQGVAFASAGIATLVPDKRLDNYSTWHRDYEESAVDYLHSVAYLRAVPGVDPANVGVYGESEGTWITPVMQVLDPGLTFNILVSAPVLPPREQVAFAVDNYLRATRVPQDVFRAIPRALGMRLPFDLLAYADFDVTPWLLQQTAPLLVVYGAEDPSMPIDQGAQRIIADAAVTGRAPVTVRYYAEANHGIRVGGVVVADFLRDVGHWVLGLPQTAGAEPSIAGARPDQKFYAAPLAGTPFWGQGYWVLGSLIAGVLSVLVGALSWPIRAWLARARKRDGRQQQDDAGAVGASSLAWPLVGLAGGSVATVAMFFGYLVVVANLAMNYERNDVFVRLGWLAVRVLGIATLYFAAIIIGQHYTRRVREREAALWSGPSAALVSQSLVSTPATGVTFWSVVVGATFLLVWLAYWGAFRLGI